VPRLPLAAVVVALAGAALAPGGARAADLQINPVLVTLTPGERSALVALRNGGDVPARFEVKVYGWDQTAEGEMKLAPTGDVVAFPALLTIPPGGTRNLRVGVTGGFGPIERAYRLFIEELPPPPRPQGSPGVQVLSRIGIPVFLAPAQVDERVTLDGLRVERGRVLFWLVNRGNVHVRPSAVKLVARDAAGATVAERALDAWYVLAGGERAYTLELAADDCRRVRSLAVEVGLARGPLRAEASAAPAGCAP
jgi:fimbrial chaperone protein